MFDGSIAEWLSDFSFLFLSILLEGAPFILLGTIVSGFLDAYLPAGAMDRLLPRNRIGAVFASGLLGIIFPVCECAVVPVIRRLVKKGLPPACALTYMLAAPIVNPVTALSTASAFKAADIPMTSSRLAMGYLMAVAVGLLLLRIPASAVLKASVMERVTRNNRRRAPAEPGECAHGDGRPAGASAHRRSDPRLVEALRAALRDFADVAVYFVIGITIVAVVNTPPPFSNATPVREVIDQTAESTFGAPAALMALAFLLSLCSTSDAFIAWSLDTFRYGARLGFLVYGPMMDLKLLFLYNTILTKRFIICLAAGLFVAIGGLSVWWEMVFRPSVPLPVP